MESKVQLFMVTRSLFRSGFFSQPHMHDAYSIHYICSGQMDFEVEGRSMALKEGDCILLPPFAEHLFHPVPEPGAQVQTMRLMVSDPWLDKQCRRIHQPLRGDATLRSMADYIAENWMQPGQGELAEIMLAALLSLFCARHHAQPVQDSKYLVTDGFSEPIRRVLHYVETHYGEGFSLEELALALNYNKNYLCTAFSGEVGLSIVEYANFLRVRNAVLHFAFNKARADEVAERIGFHSMSYFGRVFKEMVGIAPGRFATAFSGLSREQWCQLAPGEPLMQYRPMRAEQARKALEHIGQTARSMLEEKG